MTRKEILEAAERRVCGSREEDYGSPENNFGIIADLWTLYIKEKCVSPGTDVCVNADDVANLMVLLKIARIATGVGTDDSYVDLAGYAACGGEISTTDTTKVNRRIPDGFCSAGERREDQKDGKSI